MEYMASDSLDAIGKIIRLAMAPAFLIMGSGIMIQLFSGRLSRVVDRERALIGRYDTVEGEDHETLVCELRALDKRAGVVNFAILMGVCSAITISLVIAGLFIMGVTRSDMTVVIAGGFILAMGFLVTGLFAFLIEVKLAADNIHVQEKLLEQAEDLSCK